MNDHALPFDVHLAGAGAVIEWRVKTTRHCPATAPVVAFDHPAELALPSTAYRMNRELEVVFTSDQFSPDRAHHPG